MKIKDKLNRIFLKLLFIITVLVLPSNCWSQTRLLSLSQNRDYFIPLSNVILLSDPHQQLKVQDVSELPESHFNFNVQQFDPAKDTCIWIRLNVRVAKGLDNKWVFELFNKEAAEIIVFAANEKQQYTAIDTIGSASPFYNRNLHERMPAFEVPLLEGINTLYIKYKSHKNLGLNAIIQPYRQYINFSNHYYFLIGGFYFLLVLLTLYNFLFYLSTKDKIYLYYILFVFTSALECLTVDHIGFAIFWPEHPDINFYTDKYVRLLFVFGLVHYASYFLSVKSFSPALHKLLWSTFAVFALTYIVLEEIYQRVPFELFIKEFLIISMLLILLYVALHKLKQNHKPTRYFIVGYLSMLIGLTIKYLNYYGLIEGNLVVYYILFYAILVDTIMFSFSLSARLRLERQEKEHALEAENQARQQQIELMKENEMLLNKVNAELEEKVKERTAEIEESNRKILEQAQIIQQFNIRLDKENWSLNQKIKNLHIEKIIPENLSFKQMQELFPSETDYYQFLADYKWKDGFKCRKCGNTKESRMNDFYARRCSKCGQIESITAHTLFHKLKFPLDKAFYIAYSVFTSRGDLKVTDLAQQLDLNYRTCLGFKMKIEEAILDRKKRGIPLKSWEDLISDN